MIKSPPSRAVSKIGPSRRHPVIAGIVMITVIILGIPMVSTIGTASIPSWEALRIIITNAVSLFPFVDPSFDWPESWQTIVIGVRLPRVVLAGLVGAALALAGATYQGLFRNPLADPYLLGTAQGAALGAVIGFVVPTGPWGFDTTPLFAFLGAISSAAVVYLLAFKGGATRLTTLILAGVALGAFLGALVGYFITRGGPQMQGVAFWLYGSFNLSKWQEVWLVLPIILLGSGGIFLFARSLNVMQLDEDQAKQLGVDVGRIRVILLTLATLITAAAVCFTGIIGFVGIIIPHSVRLIWGPDHRFLLPLSFLLGAIFLIMADLVARLSGEIPIGIITALCGAPFFLYLLRFRMRTLI